MERFMHPNVTVNPCLLSIPTTFPAHLDYIFVIMLYSVYNNRMMYLNLDLALGILVTEESFRTANRAVGHRNLGVKS
jgi:hypothetical protein